MDTQPTITLIMELISSIILKKCNQLATGLQEVYKNMHSTPLTTD